MLGENINTKTSEKVRIRLGLNSADTKSFIQRHVNVDATSWHCIDVAVTLTVV